MNAFRTTLAAASLGLASIATSAAADDKATVQTFYDLLSNPGSEAQVAAFLSATSENWESVGDYSGDNEGRGWLRRSDGLLQPTHPRPRLVRASHASGR